MEATKIQEILDKEILKIDISVSKIIISYHESSYQRLELLMNKIRENPAQFYLILKTDKIMKEYHTKLGKRLQNIKDVALYLSCMYCHLFSKDIPTKKRYYGKIVWCSGCDKVCYVKRDTGHSVLCDRKECVGVIDYYYRTYNNARSENTFIMKIPVATRAFKELAKTHSSELTLAAWEIYHMFRK